MNSNFQNIEQMRKYFEHTLIIITRVKKNNRNSFNVTANFMLRLTRLRVKITHTFKYVCLNIAQYKFWRLTNYDLFVKLKIYLSWPQRKMFWK